MLMITGNEQGRDNSSPHTLWQSRNLPSPQKEAWATVDQWACLAVCLQGSLCTQSRCWDQRIILYCNGSCSHRCLPHLSSIKVQQPSLLIWLEATVIFIVRSIKKYRANWMSFFGVHRVWLRNTKYLLNILQRVFHNTCNLLFNGASTWDLYHPSMPVSRHPEIPGCF